MSPEHDQSTQERELDMAKHKPPSSEDAREAEAARGPSIELFRALLTEAGVDQSSLSVRHHVRHAQSSMTLNLILFDEDIDQVAECLRTRVQAPESHNTERVVSRRPRPKRGDGIKQVRVLHGHVDFESAYEVDDYAFRRSGRKVRYWMETATKGPKMRGRQRLVSQATDPTHEEEVWKKPQYGSYHDMLIMYVDSGNRVSEWSVNEGRYWPRHDARMRLMGIYEQLTDEQRARYDILLDASISQSQWDEWNAEIELMAQHIRETGTDPNHAYAFGTDLEVARRRARKDLE